MSERGDALAPGGPGAVVDLVSASMTGLASKRPVFHSEADFQHSLAWELHLRLPTAEVRLERRLSTDSNERLDLLFIDGGFRLAVELKYPVTKFDAALGDEPFVLWAQGAEDRMRFNYVWDVVRLERLVAADVADAGAAVLLTNVPGLWSTKPPRPGAADTQFRLGEGRQLAGRLGWTGTATWWQKEKLPAAVDLAGSYSMAWRAFSNVPGDGASEFRWTAVAVGPGGGTDVGVPPRSPRSRY
jgi:hypothetical protein